MIQLADFKQYLLCKDIYFRFAKHFEKVPANDIEFLLWHKTMLEKEPELTSYMYQFAFNACYEKKTFNSRELEIVFNNKFKVKDMYNMNGYDCDASTVNTAFIVNRLSNHTSFKDIPFTICNAPLAYKSSTYYSAQRAPEVVKYVNESRAMTGNTNADVYIGHRIYDIKHKGEMSTAKNHLQPWTYERVQSDMKDYMGNVWPRLEADKDPMVYDLGKSLHKLYLDNSLSWSEKNLIWNSRLAESWDSVDPGKPIPVVIQMTDKPFTYKIPRTIQEKFHISTSAVDDAVEARRAIFGVTHFYGRTFTHNAEIMTNGLINSTLANDSSMEVD